ncbi:WASH complex subunit 5 [Eurytemora carolleeae]|uniref:WASH complex subunit 5 n=1 Tax=Eurytemora carolleeae TaxID=1294199 RepID=UPI000C7930B1|nr:WASH complex subunit 5 [Eurytemora carolleeae]|eukprot:XP_023324420.1 WASH complex subunit 5-like [Eurytemora affinis]
MFNKITFYRKMKGGAEEAMLTLVARANTLLADISRRSQEIPSVFRDPRGEVSSIIADFSYLKSPDILESQIARNERLNDLDLKIKEEHLDLLKRFYDCFESIERYGTDLIQFIDDLEEGRFIQQNLENILQREEGKQLLAEAVYLQGVILLYIDQQIPGDIRERLLVSYYRYCGQSTNNSNIDTVCQLLRSAGLLSGGKRPVNYPENLFSRVSIQKPVIKQLVGVLRSEDLYNMLPYYPQPEDRSTALSVQAGMLFIILYFDPQILRLETAMMREIVDKYFSDNWVISLYLGMTFWLPEAWENYKAGKQAINNTTTNSDVKILASRHGEKLLNLIPRLEELLLEGAVTKKIILENSLKLINVVRESNVTLRWIFLHSTALTNFAAGHKRTRQLYELCLKELKIGSKDLFSLLVLSSRLEQLIREMFQKILQHRADMWNKLKEDSSNRLKELADVFGGEQKLSRIQPNKKLQSWLQQRAEQISQLDVDDAEKSSYIAVQLIQALTEARSFNQLSSNLQVIQYLSETEKNLLQMVQLVSAKDQVLVKVQILADFSYGWELVQNFTQIMQSEIKSTPSVVSDIRCVFIKMSGAMEGAVLRISEAESSDLLIVSEHYSRTLVTFIRKVLQVIPDSMFDLLDQIIALQAQTPEIPTRLEKDKLREVSNFDKRFEIAKLTHQVSVLSRGIMALGKTLVGVVQVDPHKLLEEGMRRELISRVSLLLHNTFIFNPRSKERFGELTDKVTKSWKVMESFRKSFEYIQDYIGISTLCLWQEEISRLINYAVEREASMFLRGPTQFHSQYQSNVIPIPEHKLNIDDASKNFMGRIARELIGVSEYQNVVYAGEDESWFSMKPPHSLMVSESVINQLGLSIGVPGIAGLSRLLGLMSVQKMQNLVEVLQKEILEEQDVFKLLDQTQEHLGSYSDLVPYPAKTYGTILNKISKNIQNISVLIVSLGQLTILRQLMSHHLSGSARFQAKLLRSTVESLQAGIITVGQTKESGFREESKRNLVSELTSITQWIGLDQPVDQIYIPSPVPIRNLELFLALLIIHQVSKSVYNPSTGFLLSRRPGEMDLFVLVQGVHVLLNHYHPQLKMKISKILKQAEDSLRIGGDTVQADNIHLFNNCLM